MQNVAEPPLEIGLVDQWIDGLLELWINRVLD
jgi:hypothetical protein